MFSYSTVACNFVLFCFLALKLWEVNSNVLSYIYFSCRKKLCLILSSISSALFVSVLFFFSFQYDHTYYDISNRGTVVSFATKRCNLCILCSQTLNVVLASYNYVIQIFIQFQYHCTIIDTIRHDIQFVSLRHLMYLITYIWSLLLVLYSVGTY